MVYTRQINRHEVVITTKPFKTIKVKHGPGLSQKAHVLTVEWGTFARFVS